MPIYVDTTKLPYYTLLATQHHSFFRNLPHLWKSLQFFNDEKSLEDNRSHTKITKKQSKRKHTESDTFHSKNKPLKCNSGFLFLGTFSNWSPVGMELNVKMTVLFYHSSRLFTVLLRGYLHDNTISNNNEQNFPLKTHNEYGIIV